MRSRNARTKGLLHEVADVSCDADSAGEQIQNIDLLPRKRLEHLECDLESLRIHKGERERLGW